MDISGYTYIKIILQHYYFLYNIDYLRQLWKQIMFYNAMLKGISYSRYFINIVFLPFQRDNCIISYL